MTENRISNIFRIVKYSFLRLFFIMAPERKSNDMNMVVQVQQ